MDVDTAGRRMSQGAVLDKFAPVGYEPNLQLEESDCDAVEVQQSLCHDPLLYVRLACVGHEYRDSGDVRLEKTQGESGRVVSVGR
jgi:hypothetical protein